MPPSYQKPTAHPPYARALLIGESNPYSRHPDDALVPWPAGCAGARLLSLLGWSEYDYLASFHRVNLVVGKRWDIRAARARADELSTQEFFQKSFVVLLGVRVSWACGWNHEIWKVIGGVVRVPHPSGLCRDWNDPRSRPRLRELLEPYRHKDLRVRA